MIGRERILVVHARDKPLDVTVDLELLARQTAGLTGADLANICDEAAIFALPGPRIGELSVPAATAVKPAGRPGQR